MLRYLGVTAIAIHFFSTVAWAGDCGLQAQAQIQAGWQFSAPSAEQTGLITEINVLLEKQSAMKTEYFASYHLPERTLNSLSIARHWQMASLSAYGEEEISNDIGGLQTLTKSAELWQGSKLKLKLEQKVQLDQDCKPQIAATILTTYKLDRAHPEIKTITIRANAEPEEKVEKVSRQDLLNFMEMSRLLRNSENLPTSWQAQAYISSELPKAQVAFYRLETGESTRHYELLVSVSGQEFSKVQILFNDDSSHFITDNQDTYQVDQDSWNNLKLGAPEQSASVQLKTSWSQFSAPDLAVEIASNQSEGFDNLSAYWEQGDDSLWRPHRLSLNELEPPADFQPPATHHLDPSTMVQTDLPAIKAWAARLRQDFFGGRLEMVQKILPAVQSYLTFDHNAVVGSIRPADTAEILATPLGVCQHYSNLFAALARSLGIPTRIVVGYRLQPQNIVPHAWVEVEVVSGRWLPIEPQVPDIAFDRRQYWPVATSAVLDEQKDMVLLVEEMRRMTSLRLEIAIPEKESASYSAGRPQMDLAL